MNNTRLHAMMRRLSPLLIPALIPVLVTLLYGGFLNNPLVFDDQYFFMQGNPERYVADGFVPRPRWLAYFSHGLTFTLLGDAILWQRIGNLILHAATGLALYALIRRLLADLAPPRDGALDARWAALFAALLFVLHPAAVYGAAYLIQRTTVMATLFSLLCWLSFWRGLNGSRAGLWASAAFYLLAVFSKEHAVMVPAVCAALLLLHRRSELTQRAGKVELASLFSAYAVIGIFVVLTVKRVIGSAYEPLASEMLDTLDASIPKELVYPLSVLTQAGLFFKYLLLWIVPNGAWMSIDMREPFVLPPVVLRDWAFAAAFIAYPVAACLMLWRGRATGLIGLSLLAPWLLFATEISSVRIQEIFVLYRSYLWAPALSVLFALGLLGMSRRTSATIGVVLGIACSAFSLNKLMTFGHSFYLWDEAAKLAEKEPSQGKAAGMARIYHNRGLALSREGFLPNAIEDFDRALSIRQDYTEVYNDRGAAHLMMKSYDLALKDFNTAAEQAPGIARYHAGKAQAMEGLGKVSGAREENWLACALGWTQSCEILRATPAPAQSPDPSDGGVSSPPIR
ncbi:MAG TPA: hypothetical protein VIO81_08525 [Methyloversatilis sp.]